ncbi:MAG: hypothetical protein R2778_05960 [Saprospiraceae bacterium]
MNINVSTDSVSPTVAVASGTDLRYKIYPPPQTVIPWPFQGSWNEAYDRAVYAARGWPLLFTIDDLPNNLPVSPKSIVVQRRLSQRRCSSTKKLSMRNVSMRNAQYVNAQCEMYINAWVLVLLPFLQSNKYLVQSGRKLIVETNVQVESSTNLIFGVVWMFYVLT